MKPLRFGLIGVGGMGASHVRTIQALEAEGLAKLVCVADPFADRMPEVKARFESKGIRWHLDYQKLLGTETELDAVSIATPIPLHARMTAAALARGLFIYLEKPPVPLIQQLNDLVALDARRKVFVGFQMICSTPIAQLKRWKVEGALGEIESIRVTACWPRYDGYYNRAPWSGRMLLDGEPVFDGPATNALSHLLHNIMYLGGKGFDDFDVPMEVEGEFYRARHLESYDVVSMRGMLQSNIAFHYSVNHATETMVPFRLEVIGSKGKAWTCNNAEEMGNNCGLTNPAGPYADAFTESYRQFIRFAGGERPRALTSLEDTRGYVLATNGALVASGGIHGIDPKHWRVFGSGENRGYDVTDLATHMHSSVDKGKLFSEIGVPWARRGNSVLVRSLRSLNLKDYISH